MMASGKRAFLYLQMYLGKLLTIDKLLNLDGNFMASLHTSFDENRSTNYTKAKQTQGACLT